MSGLATLAREAIAAVTPAAASPSVAPVPQIPAPVASAASPEAPLVPQGTVLDVSAVAAEARTAERARIQAIMQHPEAEGRLAQAQELAFSTDLNADACAKILASGAKAAPATRLSAATVPQPAIRPDASVHASASDDLAAAVQAHIKKL